MLRWNIGRVRNLTGTEIWLFIIARVMVGFGVGVLGMRYFPGFISPFGFPALLIGVLLFLIAAKGLFRPSLNDRSPL